MYKANIVFLYSNNGGAVMKVHLLLLLKIMEWAHLEIVQLRFLFGRK